MFPDGGERDRRQLKERCRCWAPPVLADGPLTLDRHDEACGFPRRRCDNDKHRVWVHRACGRPVRMRFCGCSGSDHGFTYDDVRGWRVHYVCGWPSRQWFEHSGSPPVPGLVGVKPVTYHEYRAVSKNPSRPYAALSEEQRRWNEQAGGTWVWD